MTTIKSASAKWTLSDVVALAALQPLVKGFVPWTAWSMRPAAIVSIINELELKRRRTVVELGSGASTIFLARAVEGTGGRLVSIEHNHEYANYIRRLISREGLERVAQVETVDLNRYAPVDTGKPAGWDLPEVWYDIDVIRSVCPMGIDMLIVDGPPAGDQGTVLVREPAVGALRDKFNSEFSIFLDDADRLAERETMQCWEEQLGIGMVIVERISLGMGSSDGGIIPTL
ncbi:class I SAM-dependent methyltransferase [Frankia sp. Cr1]|uniref:class I SAM-dependent methyltransferase n=1 Tax=Frankia sp. Cr1 TaxID=3073931 RepID=UPI002AD5117C|nr:class I SAM-dependent methyltransferase [Frankia sp. Cr1]